MNPTHRPVNPFSQHWLLPHPHLQTIIPNLFRKIHEVQWTRHRITTPDNDFLDLDLDQRGNRTLLLAIHGLEGNTNRGYMRGMIRAGLNRGWDGAGLNLRGCSGTDNNLYSSYHSGKSDDLHTTLNFLFEQFDYEQIFLVGYSLGGNICLKYAGEQGKNLDPRVKAIVGVSVPMHLESCARQMEKRGNILYHIRFLRACKIKLRDRAIRFPDQGPSNKLINQVRSFKDLDNLYTAPAHGFRDAYDYWEQSSAIRYLQNIQRPTYIVSALDDTFLPEACYPTKEAAANPMITLELPKKGGHVGFIEQWPLSRETWVENRITDYLSAIASRT